MVFNVNKFQKVKQKCALDDDFLELHISPGGPLRRTCAPDQVETKLIGKPPQNSCEQ